MYLSATRKFFLVIIAVGAMVLGHHGWGAEGFAAGAVIAGVFLLWFGRRTKASYRARPPFARPFSTIDPDLRERAGKSSGFEWDPSIKVPLGDNAFSWRVDHQRVAAKVDEDETVA